MVRISQSLEEFTEVISSTSEQHVDSRPSRQERDNADVIKLSKWLSQHPPFSVLDKLVSLGTGIVGGPKINCHNAEEIGRKELEGIVGKTFRELSFPRKKWVLPLSSVSSSIKIAGDIVSVDCTLFYQRIAFAKESKEDLQRYISYDLSPFPLSLFNELNLPPTLTFLIVKTFYLFLQFH
ncbi:hypothetical protein JTB14_037839 [Gonioctena quinquepunctata]|nr:hypothetical protein JTB14_037839 [Gonioctena quinquepunctata]